MNERKEINPIRNFYIRRFFRIAPLYYVGIIVYYIVYRIPLLNQHGLLESYTAFDVKSVLLNVLFLHSFSIKAYNFVVQRGWSIGTEMMFYLLFPFIFRLFTWVKKPVVYVLLVIASLLVSNAYIGLAYLKFHHQVFNNAFFSSFILNQLPVFIIGVSYFFLDKAGLIKLPKVVSFICFLIFFLGAYKFVGYIKYDLVLPLFFVTISFGFLFSFFKDSKFELPFLRRIGQLSFSIYICHFLFAYPLTYKISQLIGDKLNGYVIFGLNLVITLLLSILVAIISERSIEKPGINLGKRVIKKLSTSAK